MLTTDHTNINQQLKLVQSFCGEIRRFSERFADGHEFPNMFRNRTWVKIFKLVADVNS